MGFRDLALWAKNREKGVQKWVQKQDPQKSPKKWLSKLGRPDLGGRPIRPSWETSSETLFSRNPAKRSIVCDPFLAKKGSFWPVFGPFLDPFLEAFWKVWYGIDRY